MPGDGLGLSRRVLRAGGRDLCAEFSYSLIVKDDSTQPRFAEQEEPGGVPILLGRLSPRTQRLHQLAEPSRMQKCQRLTAERKEMHHQGGRLVALRNSLLEIAQRFGVATLKNLQVRVNHAVVG